MWVERWLGDPDPPYVHKFIHLAFLRYIITNTNTMHSVVHIIRYRSQQVPL